MQHNILRESNITKIYLIYTDGGIKKKFQVKLRFMDNRECYFAALNPVNFNKPKRKTPAELKVYTEDGIYDTEINILDSDAGIREVMFNVTIPKNWKFTQLRQSSRKQTELPISIKYNDGETIEATTYDLSIGGVSFYSDVNISSIHKKLSCILSIKFPKNLIINFPDGVMTVEAKFCREVADAESYDNKTLHVYKFLGVPVEHMEILKNYLLHLE